MRRRIHVATTGEWPGRLLRTKQAARLTTCSGAALLGALAVLAAGCGGGSSSSAGVAQVGTTTTSNTAVSGSGAGASSSDTGGQLVKFAECMRKHGVPDFPDPVNGQLQLKVTPNSDLNPNSQAYQGAMQSCHSLAPAGFGSGGSTNVQQQNQMLKFVSCMRKHGVPNFPDPRNGHFLITGGINPNSPQFKNAIQACQTMLPGGVAATP